MSLSTQFAHLLPPELAHSAAIFALKLGLFNAAPLGAEAKLLSQHVLGLDFTNPIGIAAGFDKNAKVPIQIMKAGFGFAEIGTVTPRPQKGNPKPRLFRLKEHHALINRLGFNNDGHEAALGRLNALGQRSGPIGINIGANKDTADFIADYEKGIAFFTSVADYFTINISSPNTPGLRALQYGESLNALFERLGLARDRAEAHLGKRPPALLKIAPDLDDAMIEAIAIAFERSGFEGMIISNTTLSRARVEGHALANEMGGLSGRPLVEASTVVLAKMRQRLGKKPILIGVGGIWDAETAIQKFEAGANLIQIYSALTYEGFGLARRINKALALKLIDLGFDNIGKLVGTQTDQWATRI